MDDLHFRRMIFRRLLRVVRQDLDWCEREGLSLVWTTGVGRTEIRVGALRWFNHRPCVAVRVETEMVTGLVDLDTAAWQLERFEFPPGLSAPVLDRGLGRCLLVCTTYCGAARTAADLPIFEHAMLKQIDSHGLRSPLRDRMGGRRAQYRHPNLGARPSWDSRMVVVEPPKKFAFTLSDVDRALNDLSGEWSASAETAAGLEMEFPLVLDRAQRGCMSMKVDLTTRHPELGSGMRLGMRLPLLGPSEALYSAALLLNQEEYRQWTGFPLLGAWAVRDGQLEFVSFVDHNSWRDGLLTYLIRHNRSRGRWATEQLLAAGGAETTAEPLASLGVRIPWRFTSSS